MSIDKSKTKYNEITIDSHHHFFTKDSINAFKRLVPEQRVEEEPEFQKFLNSLPTIEERANKTVENMEKSEVDQILLMSFSGDFDTAYQAKKMYPDHFPGIIPFIDPRYDSVEIMEECKKKGAVGIKFYPGAWGHDFKFNDERVFPYLKKALELELTPMIHFGVMKGPDNRNSWPASPMELRPWLQHSELEEQQYVIAHFGAGFLREVFLLAYSQKKRVFIDTSGSNDWVVWSPFNTLTQVFEKSIRALTPQHILFGTDSGRLTMRHDVTLRQKGILEDLVTRKKISDEDRWDILGNNTQRLFLD